jgi:hypothetical protein
MRNVTFTIATATIAVAFSLHASEALACSPGEVSGVSPSDGAVDVPTNASLFFAQFDAPQSVVLVDEASGARSELDVDVQFPLTTVALTGLAPSTSYRVELDPFENADGVIAPSREIRFTTAAATDEEAPALVDVDSDVASEKVDGALTFGEGCALSPLPYWREERIDSQVTFDLELAPDTAFVRLFRTLDGERVERSLTFTNGAATLQIVDFTSDVGDATYEIVAVDAAGNESSELVQESLGQLAGGCSQTSGATAAPIVAALILLRARRRISQRIG